MKNHKGPPQTQQRHQTEMRTLNRNQKAAILPHSPKGLCHGWVVSHPEFPEGKGDPKEGKADM